MRLLSSGLWSQTRLFMPLNVLVRHLRHFRGGLWSQTGLLARIDGLYETLCDLFAENVDLASSCDIFAENFEIRATGDVAALVREM